MVYDEGMFKIAYFLIFALFAGCKAGQQTQAHTKQCRPNIIFILADDLGYGEVGCFGQTKIQTPNIDFLARRGTLLTEHYSGSPVCASSRCSLLTGKHTGHAEVRNNREMGGWGPDETEGQLALSEGCDSIARTLQSCGYATGAFGKWGLGGPDTVGHPNNQGFDTFYGYLCQRVAHNYYPTHLWSNNEKDMLQGNQAWFSAHQRVESPPHSYEQYAAETYAPSVILDEAVSFIDTHADEPFFLYFASIIPHLALQVPDSELDAYPADWDSQPYLGDRGYLPHPRPRAAYAAMITRFDDEVGALYEALVNNGIEDNTLIVVTSDNGPSWVGGVDMNFFDSQGGLRGRKAQLWEGGIKVPTVMYWDERLNHQFIETPTAFWDWYPTLATIAGCPLPENLDGIDMTPVLIENDDIEQRGLYWEFGKSMAFRNGDWKLLEFKQKDGVDVHLYNLKVDPSETTNLALQLPQQVELLQTQARAMRTESEIFPSFLDKR